MATYRIRIDLVQCFSSIIIHRIFEILGVNFDGHVSVHYFIAGSHLWKMSSCDSRLKLQREGDDVIDADIILLWGKQKRVITGADILGRLMRGIVL